MSTLIPQIQFPEVMIGLVAPIGCEIDYSLSALEKFFKSNGYNVVKIRVTDSYLKLKDIVPPETSLNESNIWERYKTYIGYGNQLREYCDDNSILAAFAIQQIIEHRTAAKAKFEKNAFILHQFKRPEEIDLLRSVYGQNFFQVSIYSRRDTRVDNLARRISEDEGDANHEIHRGRAEDLVSTDENQSNLKYGQRVGKIFHDADFIVNTDIVEPSVPAQIERFCELLFSSNSITPTRIEYGMFAAFSAALRASDLSRQVGAAIFSENSEIVSIGSNEVPKANGGTYWSFDKFDARDFKLGFDSNAQRKKELIQEVCDVFKIDQSDEADALGKLSIMDALEYGRIVHAEMSAIMDAARTGASTKNSTLFTTTFPCHMCAKHIVASGISNVFFLEPYPKSLASRLHSDSISIEKHDRGKYSEYGGVNFTHFYGVTPRRYRPLFKRGSRKDSEGKFLEYIDGLKRPVIDIKFAAYSELERQVLTILTEVLRERAAEQ